MVLWTHGCHRERPTAELSLAFTVSEARGDLDCMMRTMYLQEKIVPIWSRLLGSMYLMPRSTDDESISPLMRMESVLGHQGALAIFGNMHPL